MMKRKLTRDWLASHTGKAASAAIVANGPSITGAGMGQLIDRFDVVCRMNRFELDSHETDVGSRTDIYVCNLLFNPEAFARRAKAAIVSRPFSRSLAYNVALGTMIGNLSGLRGVPTTAIAEDEYLSLYDELGIPQDDQTGRNPTTGLVALNCFLLHSGCYRIGLFGFDFFDGVGAGRPAYYFTSELPDGITPVEQSYYCDPLAEKAAFRRRISQDERICVTRATGKILDVSPRGGWLE